MPSVYQLTKGDKEIFKQYEKTQDPNILTDFYLRSPTSGTWWLPGESSPRRSAGYDKLYTEWQRLKQPEDFQFAGNPYTTKDQHDKSKDFPDQPAFFHNHGVLFLPYHKMLYHDRHMVRVVLGGFGSSKTFGMCLNMIAYGLTLAQFRGFSLAPLSIQALEFYEIIMNMIADTEFEKRFLIAAPQKPFPKIVFGHDGVGISKIECYPVAGNEHKLRTLTGDMAVIDQAEHEQLDLTEAIRSIGTRFRGRVSRNGRERVGTLTLLANAGDKQELWDIYDEAEYDPENYLSISPTSYDNPYLTDKDIARFEKQVGGSEEAKAVYLMGKRPLGNGQHFSRAVLEKMRDPELDAEMDKGLALQEETGDNYGYIKLEGKNVGTYEWLLPYKEGHQYLVMSDPGTQNPPNRDSGAIMIWDITDFPGELGNFKPATLAGFVWVYANNKIINWANRFADMVWRYKAIGQCGFDATGYQSGYDSWMNVLNQLFVEKVSLAGNGKSLCLNSAKVLTSRDMMKMPAAVSHVYQQLARYEYPPEPQKLRQDLVMTFIMSAWWMQRLFYFNTEPVNPTPNYDPDNRYIAPMIDRYGGHQR